MKYSRVDRCRNAGVGCLLLFIYAVLGNSTAMAKMRTFENVAVSNFPSRLIPYVSEHPVHEGFLDVTKPPYNAAGNGVTDDSSAIQAAIEDAYDSNLIVFFPGDRVYLCANALRCVQSSPQRKFANKLVGSSRGNKPVLKLQDHSDIENDLFIEFRYEKNGVVDSSRHYCAEFRDIDIDLGDNPDVMGLKMNGAQHCVIEGVHIYGEDFQVGLYGLPGSGGSVCGLQVTGGQIGIYQNAYRPNPSLTGIQLIGQSEYGIKTGLVRGPLVVVGFYIESPENPDPSYRAIYSSCTATLTNTNNNDASLGNLVLIDGAIKVFSEGGTAIYNYDQDFYAENVYIDADTLVECGLYHSPADVISGSATGQWDRLVNLSFATASDHSWVSTDGSATNATEDVLVYRLETNVTCSAEWAAGLIARHLMVPEQHMVFADDFNAGTVGPEWVAATSSALSVGDDSTGLGSGNALFVSVSGSSVNRTLCRFDAVTLEKAGDWIQADLDFRYNGTVTAAQYAPVIGLYNTAGTATNINDDAGYAGMVSSVDAYPNVALGNDTAANSGILAGTDTVNLFQQRQPSTVLVSGGVYALQLRITRTDERAAELSYLLDGDLVYSMTASDTSSPLFCFDEFGIRARYNDFVIDNFRISASGYPSLNAISEQRPSWEDDHPVDITDAAFGATDNDNTDDDALAVQLALDASVNPAQTNYYGKAVFIPRGHFHVKSSIAVPSGAALFGAGNTISVLQVDTNWVLTSADSVLITEDDPDGRVYLGDFAILGNDPTPTKGTASQRLLRYATIRSGSTVWRNVQTSQREFWTNNNQLAEPVLKIEQNGGGKFYNFCEDNIMPPEKIAAGFPADTYHILEVNSSSRPLRFYQSSIEHLGIGPAQILITNASDVAFYGMKYEKEHRLLDVVDSSHIQIAGGSGNYSMTSSNDTSMIWLNNVFDVRLACLSRVALDDDVDGKDWVISSWGSLDDDSSIAWLGIVPDFDRDELPDSWELSYASALGVLGSTEDPYGVDTDGDSVSDFDEYLNGTNPLAL